MKKKFYKGSSKARGSGIGLAVCEEIVTMHGGVLDIANAADGPRGMSGDHPPTHLKFLCISHENPVFGTPSAL